MKQKKTAGTSLAYLTVKYDIHPDIIFCALLSAKETGKAKCGPLLVEYRGKIDNQNYYLFKEDTEVVSQFPVPEELLARQMNPIRNYMEADMVQNYKPDGPQETIYSQIQELRAGKTHINLKAKVTNISKPQHVNTQFGNKIPMAKALLKDETGEINLCLWKEQVNAIAPGDQIEIENAKVQEFMGKKQLTLGSKGTIKIIQKTKAKTKAKANANVMLTASIATAN